MKNRTAWGLAGVLIVALLVGSVVPFTHIQSGPPDYQQPVRLLPRGAWGFGRVNYIATCVGIGDVVVERLDLGFFSVRLSVRVR